MSIWASVRRAVVVLALCGAAGACDDDGAARPTVPDAAEEVADTAAEEVADTAGEPDGADADLGDDTAEGDADAAPADTVDDSGADSGPDSEDLPDALADVPPDVLDDASDVALEDLADPDGDVDEDTADDVADTSDDGGPLPPSSAFGWVEGPCGVLAPLLASPDPSFVLQTFHFDGDPFDPADLDPDALTLFQSPNAGGSSKCSETFSMEVLDLCEAADLYKTENDIVYTTQGALTDLAVLIGPHKVGVSVTRAYQGPFDQTYTVDDATTILTKKLQGIAESSANVSPEDAWVKQVLHLWTLHADWADTVHDAWSALDPTLKADTILLVTVETGSDFVVTDSCDD